MAGYFYKEVYSNTGDYEWFTNISQYYGVFLKSK